MTDQQKYENYCIGRRPVAKEVDHGDGYIMIHIWRFNRTPHRLWNWNIPERTEIPFTRWYIWEEAMLLKHGQEWLDFYNKQKRYGY